MCPITKPMPINPVTAITTFLPIVLCQNRIKPDMGIG